MQTSLNKFLAACAATMFIAACSSTPAVETAKAPDARQGEAVRNICFSSQIRNWRANDRTSLIVERGTKEEYKLDLMGACEPDDAFISIGLISRVPGGSCIETGDELVTDSRFNGGKCLIRGIYKWNKDAGKAPEAAPSAS